MLQYSIVRYGGRPTARAGSTSVTPEQPNTLPTDGAMAAACHRVCRSACHRMRAPACALTRAPTCAPACRGVSTAAATALPPHPPTGAGAAQAGGMPLYYSDEYTVALPPGHRFPMERYAVTHAVLQAAIATLPPAAPGRAIVVRRPPAATRHDLLRAHDADYVDAYLRGTLSPEAHRVIGFPWSAAFVARTLAITGGTLAATADVLRRGGADGARGIAANQAGGTHHAFRGHGEGFCIFNDIAVAARAALADAATTGVRRVVVLDLDVHQGNGTAEILGGDAPRVVTVSMHGARNYPWHSRRPSTLDVDVPDGAGDDTFLALLDDTLAAVDRLLPPPHTDVLAFYQAGVDPLAADRLGRLRLTRSGLRERNERVYAWAEARRLPLVVTMGGGYARPIELSARAHADVFLQAAASWARRAQWHRGAH